jgi:maleylpyruvate isomerase
MTELGPEDLLREMRAAHRRELNLIEPLTEEQARAASALPGWTRGHVLAARRTFVRASHRQIDAALADQQVELFDGGRAGRDAEIAAHADRPAAELVADLRQLLADLDAAWSRVGPADWDRPVTYRGNDTLTSLLRADWRESEIHCVDLDLGVRPASWSPEFCVQLFDFLEPRVPDGVLVELATPDGDSFALGAGERVEVRGALTDLAAWLAGRAPVGPVESSTGTLPELQRLREAPKRG